MRTYLVSLFTNYDPKAKKPLSGKLGKTHRIQCNGPVSAVAQIDGVYAIYGPLSGAKSLDEIYGIDSTIQNKQSGLYASYVLVTPEEFEEAE